MRSICLRFKIFDSRKNISTFTTRNVLSPKCWITLLYHGRGTTAQRERYLPVGWGTVTYTNAHATLQLQLEKRKKIPSNWRNQYKNQQKSWVGGHEKMISHLESSHHPCLCLSFTFVILQPCEGTVLSFFPWILAFCFSNSFSIHLWTENREQWKRMKYLYQNDYMS